MALIDSEMKKVAFYTLGCKLNYSETSTISRSFQLKGYVKVAFEDNPDVYVINTCSVTDHADKKCKKIVREAKRISPKSSIAVIGCYAQLKPKEIAKIPGVDLVLGASEKFDLVDHLEQLIPSDRASVHASDIDLVQDFVPAHSKSDRTRTFLKVQDGCNYKCTFCTIPLARGASRSGSIDSVLNQVKEVLETGSKEIVLTGVNIGDFGIYGGETRENFFRLLQELDQVKGDHRYRISSIEPNLLTDRIIELVADSAKFAPHFHIPLQAGSDKTLKAMARRYSRSLYNDRVNRILSSVPQACIGADVIVGFPGETETDFGETLEFIKELDISYLHVFTYSERPNTIASKLLKTVPHEVRSQRSQMLRILSQKKRRSFYARNFGQIRTALFEAKSENGMMQGFTDNYIRVSASYQPLLINRLVEVELTKINQTGTVEVEEWQREPAA